jgi:DNA-binding transcriptional MerR regulator
MPHDPQEWFSTSKAAALSGLSKAMVNYLCRHGLVEPTCECQRGHGSRRHYSFGDVVTLRLVARLSESGVSVLRLKAALRKLRSVHPEITLSSLPGKRVVTDGKDIFWRDEETLERALDGQLTFAFVVELRQLRDEVVLKIQNSTSSPSGHAAAAS